jgi:hypothetical protein
MQSVQPIEKLFCWCERVLPLLKLMIEILKIDHESDLSILFGNSNSWEAPILMCDLLWVESPHCANVALMLQSLSSAALCFKGVGYGLFQTGVG